MADEEVNGNPTYDFSVLRDLRKRETLTIHDVSARSGISPAVISKIERNQSNAELATLYRLARVFGMTATDLIALAESRTAQRASETTYQVEDFQFRRLAYSNIRCFRCNAEGGSSISRPEVHRDDYEICWVRKGSVRLSLPHENHILKTGEALQFDAILEHSYEALENLEMLILHLRKEKRF
jgi:transcriptional regulator with XRE-family HTH domain